MESEARYVQTINIENLVHPSRENDDLRNEGKEQTRNVNLLWN